MNIKFIEVAINSHIALQQKQKRSWLLVFECARDSLILFDQEFKLYQTAEEFLYVILCNVPQIYENFRRTRNFRTEVQYMIRVFSFFAAQSAYIVFVLEWAIAFEIVHVSTQLEILPDPRGRHVLEVRLLFELMVHSSLSF